MSTFLLIVLSLFVFLLLSQALLVSLLRGFPGDQLLLYLREAPSAPLLFSLYTSLSQYTIQHFQQQQDKGELMIDLLINGISSTTSSSSSSHSTSSSSSSPRVLIPGVSSSVRNHWLFPLVISHVDYTPTQVMQLLNAHGIDAYKGATQLALVKGEKGEDTTVRNRKYNK
jgi:hypothetical protein